MINQNTGQLIADGFMRQECCNRRIHTAGKRTDHLAATNLLPDRLDCLFAIGAHGPARLHTDDTMNEVLKKFCTVRCMHDFRVELHAVIFALLVSDSRKGAFGEVPIMVKPSGSDVTRSPWLIQT